jgi:hypothetical protein
LEIRDNSYLIVVHILSFRDGLTSQKQPTNGSNLMVLLQPFLEILKAILELILEELKAYGEIADKLQSYMNYLGICGYNDRILRELSS